MTHKLIFMRKQGSECAHVVCKWCRVCGMVSGSFAVLSQLPTTCLIFHISVHLLSDRMDCSITIQAHSTAFVTAPIHMALGFHSPLGMCATHHWVCATHHWVCNTWLCFHSPLGMCQVCCWRWRCTWRLPQGTHRPQKTGAQAQADAPPECTTARPEACEKGCQALRDERLCVVMNDVTIVPCCL